MNRPVATQDRPTGLEGAVVADTTLSEVDGERGRVTVVGHDLAELAEAGFAASCGLIWDGQWPDPSRSRALSAALGQARRAAHGELDRLGDALDRSTAMGALRAGIAHLNLDDRSFPDDAAQLTGAAAVFATAWARRYRGAEPVAPDPSLDHAADVLRMLRGAPPAPEEARALGAYLATVIDHGFNASTFAARVVASTEAPTDAAILAGLGALEGRLHGGAPGPVLDMFDAIERAGDAERWLRGELDAGRRIMGMGHRVYRVRDPRAAILERVAASLDPTSGRIALARRVEAAAERLLAERKPDRPLRANVEFMTAVLLEALAIPRALFTAIFACGRIAGWCAHVAEQRRSGRLIRPRARYVGPRPAA
jgi:citrate synthase